MNNKEKILLENEELKKAVANLQREAEIEAALERVRAASMAMHKTEELANVVTVVAQQFQELGIDILFVYVGIYIYSLEKKYVDQWFSPLKGIKEEPFYIKLPSEPWENTTIKDWRNGKEMGYVSVNGAEAIMQYAQAVDAIANWDVFESMVNELSPEVFEQTEANHKYGNLSIVQQRKATPAEKDILKRFAKVFEQTYTRFLDLQKAEAQAREAQIEAALERVRARTMAMHKSEELIDVVRVLYQQIMELDSADWGCELMIFNEEEQFIELFRANIENENFPKSYFIRGIKHKMIKQYWKIWREQLKNTTLSLYEKEGADFRKYLFTETDFKDFSESDKAMMEVPEVHLNFAPMQHGVILGINVFAPFQEKDFNILNRFGKVFEQTYTRFLDLQKAEEQAREAQIEAALERVRARTMAMHKSEELAETAAKLFHELTELGVSTYRCNIIIVDEKSGFCTCWSTTNQGLVIPFAASIPINTNKHVKTMIEAWKKGLNSKIELRGNNRVEWIKFFKEYLVYEEYKIEKMDIEEIKSVPAVFNNFPFKQGFLTIHTTDYLSTPDENILTRFAKVFQQTYTRFLDLKKAETQAREAQIEATLERVRARAMAMHNSSELADTSTILFEQLLELGIEVRRCGFGLPNDEVEKITIWSTRRDENGKAVLMSIFHDYDQHPMYQNIIKAFQNNEPRYKHELHGEDLKNYYRSWEKTWDVPQSFKDAIANNISEYYQISFWESGMIYAFTEKPLKEEEFKILDRFANSFELTYRRFLDLQTAEAQAREAQIEVAMERVRARAMAMRRSDELSEAAELLYNEFIKLGVESFSCGYLINDDEKGEWKIWLTNPGEKFFKEFWTAPYEADHNLKARYESWKRKEEFHCAVLEGEENRAHHHVISEYAPWKADMTDGLPPQLVFNSAHFSLGHLLVISPERLSTELEQAMVRFAVVFDLTYRRFLDLEKAEEQSRKLKLIFDENQRLLHSILPEQIAEQIRTGRQNVVKRFEEVSILFADIVGFTILSENAKPSEVVAILNGLFSKFDDLTDQFHLEKIKTIGDAYMVASGVPEEIENHAHTIFHFAREMLEATKKFNQENNLQLKMRIGISSGPVVAGVIGKKKFAYDLWGDTVNTAARMEAYGQAGKIQVAPASYDLLKKDFAFEKIPDVDIKGKGVMDLYLWKPAGMSNH